MTFYEIENERSPSHRNRKKDLYDVKGYDLIIVDCSKLPTDLDEMKDYIEQYIVID
jgi:hypothetical protein